MIPERWETNEVRPMIKGFQGKGIQEKLSSFLRWGDETGYVERPSRLEFRNQNIKEERDGDWWRKRERDWFRDLYEENLYMNKKAETDMLDKKR